MPLSPDNLLRAVKVVLETPQALEMCDRCQATMPAGTPHLCHPETPVRALTGAMLAYLYGARSPKARAKGYAVT